MKTTTATSNSLVSVVIPCYNQARFLKAAIESALRQDYQPIEVIVVDDGSPDHTGAIAAGYPSVRYWRQENQGLGRARNAGLRLSNGEHVVFLDSDDELLPQAITTNLRYLRAAPHCAFVAGSFRYMNADGSQISPVVVYPVRGDDLYLDLLQDNFISTPAAVLYRRDRLMQVGGFDHTVRGCEDYDLYLRLSYQWPAVVHDAPVALYRRHGSGMSTNPSSMLRSALRALDGQRERARQRGAVYAKAYAAGRHCWRNRYGRELLLAIRTDFASGRQRHALRGAVAMAPHVAPAAWFHCRRQLRRIAYNVFGATV